MTHQGCPTGKSIVRERHKLEGIALSFSLSLNAQGLFAADLYGYKCPRCKHWHLTKLAEWEGRQNFLVHTAAPRALQVWAMTGELPVEDDADED